MQLYIDEFETPEGKIQFWVSGHPDGDMGPYNTRREAEEDKKGILAFEQNKNDPEFLTVDPDQWPK